MRTEEEEESANGSDSSSDSDEEEEKIEWLATTREKRANAGNRLHNLLQQEDPDDELELLFQEDDDDVGFSDVEADHSDVQMDSSDDDDDKGPPAAGEEDLDGEKELQRQAKAEKAKKRKAGNMPKIFKKKVKIDPTVSRTAPTPRPKKKSERASWLPTAEEAPTRASHRQSTKLSKRQLHEQMVDREIKRLKQLANMEKAAAAKAAAKKPALTQADRLAEAARVEKANSKSLSRWEEAEQQREEEQRLKLLALKNRTLNGPVITWWSGMGEWVGGKLKHVGKNLVVEEKEKPISKKRKAIEMEADSEVGSVNSAPSKTDATPSVSNDESKAVTSLAPEPLISTPVNTASSTTTPPETSTPKSELITQIPTTSNGSANSPPLSNNIAVIPPVFVPPAPPKVVPQHNYGPPNSSVLAPPAGLALWAPMSRTSASQPSRYPPFSVAPPILDGSLPVPGLGYNYAPRPAPSLPTPSSLSNNAQPSPPPQPPAPPLIEHAGRSYIILNNFDELAIKDKTVQLQVLFGGRKFVKVQSKLLSL